MDDRFKFRIYKKHEKRMVYDVTYLNPMLLDEKINKKEAKNNILMQCTGLRDKNDKLIYECDVVKIAIEHWNKEKHDLIYLICWDTTQWQLGLFKTQRPKAQPNRRRDRKIPFKNIVSFDDYTPKKDFANCEIIGNIYEDEEYEYKI